jgi:glycosyltransferase involved in cell wall biosynthesis
MYKVEPYVERCLYSLENQDIPKDDYEIICINDGSPDKCREVVLRLQEDFENIILIDQENQGVSRARNNGIDRALGEYLLFIDPDDYVDARVFGHILMNASAKEAQVSFLGFTLLNEDGTIYKRVFNEDNTKRIFPGTEAYFVSRGDGSTDPDRMWAVLYKREFMNFYNLRYLPDVPYLEDGEFIARILSLAKHCIFDGSSFYQRTMRPGSATNSNLFNAERATNGFILAARNLKKFQQAQNLNEKQSKFLNQPICKFVVLVISSSVKPFSLKRIRNIKKMLGESGLGKVKLDSVNGEFTRLGLLYNKSIFLLILYLFIINRIRFFKLRVNRILT